jgi:hypothetical protein
LLRAFRSLVGFVSATSREVWPWSFVLFFFVAIGAVKTNSPMRREIRYAPPKERKNVARRSVAGRGQSAILVA